MRIGQTSLVVFVSKLGGSVLGFLATLYFARVLGAEILGYYSVVLALVSWLKFGGTLGVTQALAKRISEGASQSAYFTAGVLWAIGTVLALTVGVVAFAGRIDAYVGNEVWHFVAFLVPTGVFLTLINSTLNGERKVHIAGLLTPTNLVVTSVIQIALVYLDYGLTGMLVGYLTGEIVVGSVGALFLSSGLELPTRHHFRDLYDYAKYSWLNGLRLRAYNDVDILVLSALASPALVGVYAVAWSLARFVTLFGAAVRNAIFPEVSYADASGEDDRVQRLTSDSLAFVGLVAIPGLFGGLVLGDRILQIYGDEFAQGTVVLALLISATLVYSYQQQMLTVINAVDRPEITFRINSAFIVANLVLNVVLVLWIGWVGAAVASLASAGLALVLTFHSLRRIVQFEVPVRELGRQVVAAVLMTVIVVLARWTIETADVVSHNAAIVVGLVLVGAVVYFLTLLAISPRFREVVAANTPIEIPFLT